MPRIFSRGVRQRLINPVANSINVAAGPPTRRSAEDERRSTPRDPRASSTPAARRRAEASGCARRACLKVAGGSQRVGVEAEEVVAEALPFGLRAVSALQGPRERATTWTTCRSTRRSTRRAANLKKQIVECPRQLKIQVDHFSRGVECYVKFKEGARRRRRGRRRGSNSAP